MKLRGILLAAGESRRFGARKLLAPLDGGAAVAEHAARALLAAAPRALAVVRPGDDALAALLSKSGLEVVECERSRRGMGASIACGVAASVDADAWIVALGDMPGVSALTVRRLARALRDGAAVAAPFHHGRRGLPVGFGRMHRDALLALDGERGARDIVAAAGPSLRAVDVSDPGVLWDIDRPSDLGAAGPEGVEPMSEYKCPFSAPLVSETFGCARALSVTRRGGPDVACTDAGAQARCEALHERLKAAALQALGVDDNPLTTPHSAMVKIQCGGLLGLQRLAGGGERVDDVDALVQAVMARWGGAGGVPVHDVVGDIEGYRLRRRKAR